MNDTKTLPVLISTFIWAYIFQSINIGNGGSSSLVQAWYSPETAAGFFKSTISQSRSPIGLIPSVVGPAAIQFNELEEKLPAIRRSFSSAAAPS